MRTPVTLWIDAELLARLHIVLPQIRARRESLPPHYISSTNRITVSSLVNAAVVEWLAQNTPPDPPDEVRRAA